jgi:sporulation protein YlmC with PRC-barrel domain
VDVVADVLDREVVDRNGHEMGRVDGILLDSTPGEPPRLAAILIGPSALGDRVHPGLGRFVRMIERFCNLTHDRPARIDFTDIAEIGRKVRLRVTVGDTGVDAVERRLRHWVRRLPGSR